jgi:sugar-specific transcriptional regulator TrmB
MATLRDLGLSEYEAQAYRTLLERGPTIAKELSHASGVPMGRIYDVLTSLEQSGLVRTQAASRPKKYVGVDPETALGQLLEDKQSELDRRARQYEAIVRELTAELAEHDSVERQFRTTAVGREESVDLLVGRLSAADERIVVVAGDASLPFGSEMVGERVVGQLAGALERGVHVSILLAPRVGESVPDTVWDDYHHRLATDDGFEMRTDGDVSGSFSLIDDVEVCLEVPDPLDPARTLALIDLDDTSLATELRETFERRWPDAEPLSR